MTAGGTGVMTMAGERLAFLREIFLRRVAKSNDKRRARRRSFSDLAELSKIHCTFALHQ